MKDESMVEVLARAICRERFDDSGTGDDGWDSAPPELRDDYMREARACLQALLDHGPTKEMIDAAHPKYADSDGFPGWQPPADTFRAMISKALGE